MGRKRPIDGAVSRQGQGGGKALRTLESSQSNKHLGLWSQALRTLESSQSNNEALNWNSTARQELQIRDSSLLIYNYLSLLSCMHMPMYTLENMHNNSPSHVKCWWWRVVLIHWFLVSGLQAQQAYLNNDQLDCDNNSNNTKGFVCNGPRKSCLSYLTFRSAPPSYDSPPSIAYLLNSNPSDIATINQISDVNKIPKDTVLIVPVNCSCSGHFYQYNASYTLKYDFENYYTLANNTYQGLTTCQALKAHNPYYYRNLSVGMDLLVPLMCACPTANQTAAGFNYLLIYLVTWGDYISSIADTFGVDDIQSIFDANSLSSDLIFPFTPILVPLKNPPTRIQTTLSPPPPKSPVVPNGGGADSSKKWVYVGVGIGAALLVLLMPSGIILCLLRRRLQSQQDKPVPGAGGGTKKPSYSMENNISLSVSSGGIRHAAESLTVYKYEELQKAAGFFGEANRIKGCVYRGLIKGDDAAIKMMKGDVSEEINILKLINHSNVIRLSGFCVHKGNTYLVYEYAENGSLSDWLHGDGRIGSTLGWKQRVQIACDVANALNYLHNFTNPPCIHKNLKSSNILLDGNMRGKVANFGLARRLENEEGGGGRLQLTRHVVGTQGYMAPEYMENGLITPELDAFAFGVVILELLTGKEAAPSQNKEGRGLCVSVNEVLEGDDVRHKLRGFIDPCLTHDYPFDLAFTMAQLAKSCIAHDLNARPTMSDILIILSKILSSSLDWDSFDDFQSTGFLSHG